MKAPQDYSPLVGIEAWWVEPPDGRLGYEDGRVPARGIVHSVPDINRPVVLCRYGMHGGLRLLDAIAHGYNVRVGTRIWRVNLFGLAEFGDGKIAAQHRTYIEEFILTRPMLEAFYRWCAKQVLDVFRLEIKQPDLFFSVFTALSNGDIPFPFESDYRVNVRDSTDASYELLTTLEVINGYLELLHPRPGWHIPSPAKIVLQMLGSRGLRFGNKNLQLQAREIAENNLVALLTQGEHAELSDLDWSIE